MVRGRKRKPGKRYPCGKRMREETERDAMSTVLDARKRHFGVSGKEARDERRHLDVDVDYGKVKRNAGFVCARQSCFKISHGRQCVACG